MGEASDYARGLLNDACFKRLYADEDGVQGAVLQEPVNESLDAALASEEPSPGRS